jgi:predicted deacylase
MRRLLKRWDLLEVCRFYFIPTVNVDCAHYGGNGLNADRRNTNRHWFDDVQPENAAVISYFDSLRKRGQRIHLALDVHAGGIFRNHVLMPMGSVGGTSPSREALAEQERWLDLLEEHAGLRREDGWPLPQLHLRATDYFHQVHGAVAFCLELSSCSYFDPKEQRTRPFGTEAFEVLAEGLVGAWEKRFCGQ